MSGELTFLFARIYSNLMEPGGLASTQKRSKMDGSTVEIISNLPRHVLEKVLACLTIQEAVMTSVLSRKWRCIWKTLPQLVFNDNFCRGSWMRVTTDKLMMNIYKALLLHQGPILKFTLSLPELKSCPEIDQFISFVSNKGIREFTLHIRKGEPYKVPSTLFSCLQLEHLNLHSCMLKSPPGFKGFARLLSLELNEVRISGDVLSNLASNCLLLERLILRSSTSFDYLEIMAPNLKKLCCEGLFKCICIRMRYGADVSLVLKGSRNQLRYNEGEISNSVMLLGSLTMAEVLVLNYPYVKCMAASGVRERLPTTLNNLGSLHLRDICFEEPDEISIVLYLIRCSPKLRLISISAFHRATAEIDHVVDLFDLQGWSDVSLNKLSYVTLEEVFGIKAEMEFIRLLLAKSPMLETMNIKLKSMVVAERLRIVEELVGFRRASTRAVITFPN